MNKETLTKTGIAALTSATLLVSLVTPAFAEDTATRAGNLRNKLARGATESGEATKGGHLNLGLGLCQRLRGGDASNKKKTIVNRFQRLGTLLTTWLAKKDTQGYDTSKVRADLTTFDWNAKVTKLGADIDALAAASKGAKCNLKGQLDPAVKTALDTVKKDIQEMRDFIKTTLRPDIIKMLQSRPRRTGSPKPSTSASASATPVATQ